MKYRELKVENIGDANLRKSRGKWLQEGPQTTLNAQYKEVLNQRKPVTLFETLNVVGELIDELRAKSHMFNAATFRTLNVNQIIESNNEHFGCSEHAMVAAAVLRHYGIPAKFVETIHLSNSVRHEDERGVRERVSGHCYVKLKHPNGKWVYYDGTKHLITDDEASIGTGYTRHAEGLDSWHIGIKNFQDVKDALARLRDLPEKTRRAREIKRKITSSS